MLVAFQVVRAFLQVVQSRVDQLRLENSLSGKRDPHPAQAQSPRILDDGLLHDVSIRPVRLFLQREQHETFA